MRILLRLEGAAAFAAALALYGHSGFSWPAFALLFLTNLSMLGYLANSRTGANSYNLVHTYIAAVALSLAGFFGGVPVTSLPAVSFGLPISASTGRSATASNTPSEFDNTHLGGIGRRRAFARRPRRREHHARYTPIQTGRVRIKQAQIAGRGHGLWRQLQPILSREWADWSPTYAWAIEHPEGVIVVDTGAATHLKSLASLHPVFSAQRSFRHRAGAGSRSAVAKPRHRGPRRQDGGADAFAHRPRRRSRAFSP